MFVSVNGSEDLALLPDGLVFVSSVSALAFSFNNRDVHHQIW